MKALLRSSIIGMILLGAVAAFSSAATSPSWPGLPCPPRPPVGLGR